jgi:uncharacterized short protein YbdD (DUF466 family)
MRRAADFFARLAWALRRVIGAPDYAAYVAHVRQAHPERTPMPAEQFRREALVGRYDRPGSRCC